MDGKIFKITGVARDDIAEKLGVEVAESFTDEEMTRLASKMADAYLENGFWVDLPIIAEYILEERKEK